METSWARSGFLVGLLLVWVFPATSQTLQFTEREVTFRNGAVELRGTLMVPAAEGRHPAVVFLHGSGPATRAGARPYAEEFAKLGVASLFFDKRGSGESGGSWTTSSLEDLAQDALAAVGHLKTEAGIDPERIGFWGVSQAAWVATLAASRSQDIAFMVLISGGGATPRESEVFSYQQAFEHAGLSEAEKAEAFSLLDDYFRYLATGEGRSALLARLESGRDSRWYPLARLDRILPSEQNRPNWSWVATWDPAPHIEKLKQPILLMFGDRDTDQPTATAVARWREGLAKAGNDKVTLVVFPGAGHGIRMRTGMAGGDHTGGGRAPFADGYAEVMLGWLWRHVVSGEPSKGDAASNSIPCERGDRIRMQDESVWSGSTASDLISAAPAHALCRRYHRAHTVPLDAACGAPQNRHFDFWLGTWTVTDTSGNVLAVNDVTGIARGCGLRGYGLRDECTPSVHNDKL